MQGRGLVHLKLYREFQVLQYVVYIIKNTDAYIVTLSLLPYVHVNMNLLYEYAYLFTFLSRSMSCLR